MATDDILATLQTLAQGAPKPLPEVRTDLKAPFPWFGGKRRAAALIWSRLGNPSVYVEPFAGSLATLLCRPIPEHIDRTGLVENVNDLDGYIVNAWRSIAWHPEETSKWANWPVTELDLHTRPDG